MRHLLSRFTQLFNLAYFALKGGTLAARRLGVKVGEDCRIYIRHFGSAPFLITIGHRTTLTSGVRILTHDGATGLVFNSSGRRYQNYAPVVIGDDVFIGVNALDYSGYPDCRPEYISAYQRMANLATKAGVEGTQELKIHTPLIELKKAQIIEVGLALGVDYGLTRSCYDPSPEGQPCGACDSCLLRAKGFAEAGLADPLLEGATQT